MDIEWLMIADGAEVVGNKLYLLGGGWNNLNVRQSFPFSRQIGIALAFNVPWAETNERRAFELEILTEDGVSLHKVGGNLEVGRAAGIQPGTDQRVQMAANTILTFNEPGNYVIVARVNDHESKRVTFRVLDATQSLQPQQSPPDLASP